MKHRRFLSTLLALAILLSCVGWTPSRAEEAMPELQMEQSQTAEPMESAVYTEQMAREELPEIVAQEAPVNHGHVGRLENEEADNLNQFIFLNQDGSKTMYLYDHPVKYRDEAGKVHDISLNIADTDDTAYPFRTEANWAVTAFPRELANGITLESESAQIKMIPILPENSTTVLNHMARRVDEDTVAYTYDSATQLEYQLTYAGFKEEIVVSEYTGQTEYHFFLYTNGLALTQLDGGYYLTDEAGNIQSTIGDIIVFTADERNNTFGQLQAETVKENGIYLLTIVLEADYLADPNTQYPIRIDPTVSLTYAESGADAIEDVLLQSGRDSLPEYGGHVIGKSSKGISRLLMRFPGIDFSALEGVTVTYAAVSLRDLMCEEAEMPITCYPFTGDAWTESTADWSVTTQDWGAALSSHIISYDYGEAQPSAFRYFFEITGLAQQWVNGSADEGKGIILRSTDAVEGSDALLYKTFASYERASYKPTFTMTYRSKISLNKSVADIDKGATEPLKLTATTVPSGRAVTWNSSNPSVATVDNGEVTPVEVGVTTITATCEDAEEPATCTVYVTVADGVYYIKNFFSTLYLNVTDGGIANNTDVCQQTAHSTDADDMQKIRQMWKICYLGDGCYSIRPLHKMDMGLHATNNNADIYDIGVTDTNAAIPNESKWTIQWSDGGYIIKNCNKNGIIPSTILMVSGHSRDPGATVCLSTGYSTETIFLIWTLIPIAAPPVGMIVYDTMNGVPANIERLYVAPQEKRSMTDMKLSVSTYPTLYSQSTISWTSNNKQIAAVDSTTGTITGISPGITTLTITATVHGVVHTMQYTIEVTSLPQGTYFIKNKETGYYVDTEYQSVGFGRFVWQEEFHGGRTQKWTITHLGDGTYAIGIVTQYSTFYLGVKDDSVSEYESMCLRYTPFTDGMKWIIEPTGNGSYIIIPKSGCSTGYVLYTSSAQAYAASLKQRSYTNDDLYTDEWYFRIVESAFSIGGEFFSGEDVVDAHNTWIECGYSSEYDISPSIETLSANNLNSEVVYFSSHGSQHHLKLLNGIYLTDGTNNMENSVSIDDIELSNAKLYIYDACETALLADDTGVNLCTQTLAAGVECVIGWYRKIDSGDAKKWQERFQTALINGSSVSAAADAADLYCDYYSNNTIKAHIIYGNENLIMNANNSYIGLECSPMMTPGSNFLRASNISYPMHNQAVLKSILRTEFNDFYEGDAAITITYTNTQKTNYVIDYLYLNNGYITACGFTLIVKNGTITHMQYNNAQTLERLSQENIARSNVHASQIAAEVISAAIEQANDEVYSIDLNYTITEQHGEMFYDIQENKYYYRIFTGYEDSNGTCGAVVTMYELQV